MKLRFLSTDHYSVDRMCILFWRYLTLEMMNPSL